MIRLSKMFRALLFFVFFLFMNFQVAHADQRFKFSNERVITDTATGLQWYFENRFRHLHCHQAENWIDSLKNRAGGGWRLPEEYELKFLWGSTNNGKEFLDRFFNPSAILGFPRGQYRDQINVWTSKNEKFTKKFGFIILAYYFEFGYRTNKYGQLANGITRSYTYKNGKQWVGMIDYKPISDIHLKTVAWAVRHRKEGTLTYAPLISAQILSLQTSKHVRYAKMKIGGREFTVNDGMFGGCPLKIKEQDFPKTVDVEVWREGCKKKTYKATIKEDDNSFVFFIDCGPNQ